jgi:hypothetical protein
VKKPPITARLKSQAKAFDDFEMTKEAALLLEAADTIDRLPFCEWVPELTPGGVVSRAFHSTACDQTGVMHSENWKFCPYCGQRLSLVTEWVVAALKETSLSEPDAS